jgi:ribonuclease J
MGLCNGCLRVIPLGGVGEIGKNMMVLEYGDDIIVLDAGLMFPESDMLGVDLVVPDVEYLVQRKERVRGIILTHGHEDHIGALPWVLAQVNAPVFAARLTRGLAEVRLREHPHVHAEFHTIEPSDVLRLGAFQVEFFHICHSIPDALGVAVTTPAGLVVHSSDYKFDTHPVDGRLTDFAKLSELGKRGVLLLLSDSTNAEVEGFTPSEREVGETLGRVLADAPGRVIVATFASNISRIQQVAQIARRCGRRLGVVGRSMVANVNMAMELGYLDLPPEMLLTPEEMERLPGRQVAIVCTGTQGEPASALVRMSMGEHRAISIRQGDTVILSATPIPGNEDLINHTIDNLFRLGADVLYEEIAKVHVSGHGSREDHKLMISLTRPKYFIPIHGEYRHLVLHARLAESMGIPKENILIIESGQVVEVGPQGLRLAEKVSKGHVLVDGLGVGDVGPAVLRDRHLLSQDGFLVAIVGLDRHTGQLLVGPEILSRGFMYGPDAEEVFEEAKERIRAIMDHGGPSSAIGHKIKNTLSEFCYQRTRRRPMILPFVLEV